MATTFTVSIDFGSKYIGIALIMHSPAAPNRVLYAAVIVVEAKPLNASINPRTVARRIRRTGKTHRRRLRRLGLALGGIRGAEDVLRFCRRRGYAYDPGEEGDETELAHAVSRDEFFEALAAEVDRVVPERDRGYVLRRCGKHLNAERRGEAELRPARFENRHPSKCQWEGCTRNVPRKGNALREQLAQTLFVWLRPIFDEIGNKGPLRDAVERQIDRMVGLARGYANRPDADEKKALSKQKKRAFADMLDCVADHGDERTVKRFVDNWRKTYSRQLTAILTKKQGGRLRYCRRHSREYVDVFLAGKQPPHRTEVHITDLFGRSQQILFERIWRLVHARILPLANGQIDRVVVERVAFDVLAGPFKQRVKLSEDRAAEMYWHGPMLGFDSRPEMLKEEFDGRCAYCGRKRKLSEVEHILPRSRFPFDSYFNILPSCAECNRGKGARSLLEAGKTVDEKAFEAYSDYIGKKRPPHLFHTIKKGMLKLMTDGGSMATAERQLALLADNLVSITNTQKSPRPLARFLATEIEKLTGHDCKPQWLSGRHTALYREIILPEYDKKEEKENGGLVNHAVDAIVAGCKLPSAAALENPRWYTNQNDGPKQSDMLAWRKKVLSVAPELAGRLPRVEPIERLEFFENDLGDGYVKIDLSAFNWNQQRKSGHKLDPFGTTADGKPLKRKAADDVLKTLLIESKRDGQIAAIAHRGLRQLLERHRKQAARQFVCWLQKTTRKGLADGKRGTHPSDAARYAALEAFVNTPADKFLSNNSATGNETEDKSDEERETIPATIGIRCINAGVKGRLGVTRCNAHHEKGQLLVSHPQYREFYIGYAAGDDGTPDRSRPIVFSVNQAHAVMRRIGSRVEPVTDDPTSVLQGIPLGGWGDRKGFLAQWRAELHAVFEQHGIVRWFRVGQGCYIEKTDGTAFQLCNFDDQKEWMKNGPFKNIQRVYRSPLRGAVERANP